MATSGHVSKVRDACIERLLAHESAAVEAAKEKLKELKEIESNYLQLKERLTTLPTRLSHSVTVPLNSVGFFQGQLIHTNEISVLLSSEILVQVTASKALEILNRRVGEIRSRQQKTKEEIKHFKHWKEYTVKATGTPAAGSESDDGMDINEEYNEEREAEWRKKHLEIERARERTELKKVSNDVDEEALWQRLEELELEEQMERYEEMRKKQAFQQGRDHDESEVQVQLRLPEKDDMNDIVVNKPSSSFNTVIPNSSSCPKSILKQCSSEINLKNVHFKGESETQKRSYQSCAIDSDDDEEPEKNNADQETPFTGLIVERSSYSGKPVGEHIFPQSKRISRFKASRM
ncbi:unconventional prefoldin RPB5 interactor-like isoform X2 [Varroa destructor]|uniref:Unconventional prefoldin RPB5 interactor n=1 Tax=Varroa destructor TaxID=109461 RepID=A0A7M7JDB8_VARDE|nr:unconventional prefoldin RPB5 interactor-like isoform X2 [Varroa destructor]